MTRFPITIHIDTVVEFDGDMTEEEFLFWYNDGTHCINNDLIRLVEEEPGCQCRNRSVTIRSEQ